MKFSKEVHHSARASLLNQALSRLESQDDGNITAEQALRYSDLFLMSYKITREQYPELMEMAEAVGAFDPLTAAEVLAVCVDNAGPQLKDWQKTEGFAMACSLFKKAAQIISRTGVSSEIVREFYEAAGVGAMNGLGSMPYSSEPLIEALEVVASAGKRPREDFRREISLLPDKPGRGFIPGEREMINRLRAVSGLAPL
jgi:hypothetical protein